MNTIPSQFQDLLSDQARAIAYLATLMPDGSPQVTPVWFNTDGEFILVNSAKGRVKDRNMRLRRRVALAIADPQNPYRYIQVRGQVVEITEEGAFEHIDALCLKYTGNPKYPSHRPGDVRVIYKILPDHATTMG